jgi:predicted AlkP superfamily pyrophosphatase or phosphodiesterase
VIGSERLLLFFYDPRGTSYAAGGRAVAGVADTSPCCARPGQATKVAGRPPRTSAAHGKNMVRRTADLSFGRSAAHAFRRISSRRRIAAWLAVALSATACGAPAPQEAADAPAPSSGAALVLLIAVDQMRPDYLERFDAQLTGGLRHLLDEGAVFVNTRQGHAITSTAPGHAAMLSGRYPRTHGIVDNGWYDHALGREERAASDPAYRHVGLEAPDDGPAGAPTQFRGSSLVGWLKQRDPRSLSVSISRKARSAVLSTPEGEHVYWWHAGGPRFVTSTYYRDELPDWVAAFNDSGWLSAYAGGAWELLEPEDAYTGSRPDDYPAERGARGFGNVFPHPLPQELPALAGRIQSTPYMDQATLDLGRAAITALGLGQDEVTDVLALGLSSTDSIGHAFGPFSREVHDQVLRLDRMLGEFFAFVDETVGLDRMIIALTSDHGVVPLPEYSRELGEDAERVRMREILDGIDARLGAQIGGADWFESHSYGWLQLDREQAAALGADPDALVAAARDYVASLDAVAAVFTRDELLAGTEIDSPFTEAVRRSFYPDRSGDLYLVHWPLSQWETGAGSNHQSPHDYDQRVPLILSGPGIAAGVRWEDVDVVDLAPTLARLLGLSVPDAVDGTPLPGF